MRTLWQRAARFRKAEEAVSAIEFSIVLPVLLVLLLGGSQVVLYIDATRKVQRIANSVSEMLSQAAPATSDPTTASVNATDLNFSYDAALVIFPYVMTDATRQGIAWRKDLTVSMAGISFSRNSNTCPGTTDLSSCYDAKVNWTSTGTSSTRSRPCTPLQQPVDNGAPYGSTNLPRSLYGPGSVIAVDVFFTFTPTFGSGLLAPVSITRSAFVQPRYVNTVTFDPTNTDGIAITCPTPAS